MPVNQKQMRDMMETDMKGKTMEQMMKETQKRTESAPARQKQKTSAGKNYDEEGLIKKTKRRMKELFYGDKTYMPGHKKMTPEKETRTAQVEGDLKKAGLSEKEIGKLKGKK